MSEERLSEASLVRLEAQARDFEGRFFYDEERGDIGYIAKVCDEAHCDCERRVNADGDQDCSHALTDWEGEPHLCEPLVGMLNAVPHLISEVRHLRAALPTPEEREALRWAMENVQGVFNLDWPAFTREERARSELALAALARLVEERGA